MDAPSRRATSTARVITVWVVIVPPLDREVVRHGLLAHLDDDPGTYASCREVGRQRAEQHVALTLNLADLGLPDTEIGGKLNLGEAGFSAYRGKVNHSLILP